MNYLSRDVLTSLVNQLNTRLIEKDVDDDEDYPDDNNEIIYYIGELFELLINSEIVRDNDDYYNMILKILSRSVYYI